MQNSAFLRAVDTNAAAREPLSQASSVGRGRCGERLQAAARGHMGIRVQQGEAVGDWGGSNGRMTGFDHARGRCCDEVEAGEGLRSCGVRRRPCGQSTWSRHAPHAAHRHFAFLRAECTPAFSEHLPLLLLALFVPTECIRAARSDCSVLQRYNVTCWMRWAGHVAKPFNGDMPPEPH